jgi:hypothetical protein
MLGSVAISEPISEIRIGLAAHFDAIDGKDFERLANLVGKAFFADVRHRAPTKIVVRNAKVLRNLEGGCLTSGPPRPMPSN